MNLSADKEEPPPASATAPTNTGPGIRLMPWMLNYFDVVGKGSSLQTEILAGLSTFLALSYIFVVNPAILAQAGMNMSAVLFATIITSGLATLAMGFWARLPFALAPGMEMNAYVAFFVVGALGFTWQQALGAVFWSGVLFILLTLTRVREKIIAAIPQRMKFGLSLSVGVFLALVAFKVAGLLRSDGVKLVGLGDFTSTKALALYVSFALVLLLDRFRVRGAVMISILCTAALCHALAIGNDPERAAEVSSAMFSGIGKFDLAALLQPKMLSVILILFLIDFYGSVAKLIGLSMNTSIALGGELPRLREALLIDSLATTAGSALGTSSLTVYVESGVGIRAGGRTGLTAVVCGMLMLTCLALAPFLNYIPVIAASGALLYVAIGLCPRMRLLRQLSIVDRIALASMPVTVIASFALDRAMLVGYVPYLWQDLRARRPNPYMLASVLLLLLGAVAQSM